MELDDKIYSEIKDLCTIGDKLAESKNFSTALQNYWKAYDLIPEPKTDWEATTWILAAIGDTNFLVNDFKAGADNLASAMNCPGAIGNPFFHLRLGQCYFELGNIEKAADELTRTYAIEGKSIFNEDNPKYFEFLKTQIELEKPKRKPWWKF